MDMFRLWGREEVRRVDIVLRAMESGDREGGRTAACSVAGELGLGHTANAEEGVHVAVLM